MALITRIRTNDKEQGFFDIEISEDDEKITTLSVHEDILVREGLRKGLELSVQQVEVLRNEASGIRAYNAGIRYLSYRMHSVFELRAYLEKKQFGAEQVHYAIQRLEEENLLNDSEFAVSFVRTRIQTSTKGPQLIYRELIQAGVAQDLAAQADELFPLDQQVEHARKYLIKQTSSVKNKKSKTEARLVLSRLLMQRGYSREISEQVLNEMTDFLIENEKSALVHQAEKAMQKYKKYSGREFALKVKNYLYRKGFPLDAINAFIRERTSNVE
ncbi:RecX family transcriptional regulator [Sporolactobacillus kofuensis]|uniref:Regulatory protein RecX n=1 Tax=Sporolactobacillus kofuensis TaxID=269672 RepID=A0ABW1WFC1_9BACL|nr:RecX family transcriptional regulator [Sporolactobacillus kofuensis]MCO7175307.1 RecX family transcriptional regulator [Sporolactobacillus kofuensis]